MSKLLHALAARNLRDVGGLATGDGRTVRRGVLYRSAHLHDLHEAELQALTELGIRTACDLRSRREGDVRPGPFREDPDVVVHHLGVEGTRATGDPVQTIVEAGITKVEPGDVAASYRYFVDEHPAQFGGVVQVVADPANHPVLVHCSAGKDRTGIAVALMLSAVGVDDGVIVEEYERTNELWTPGQWERAQVLLAEAGVEPEPVRTYFHAPGEAMHMLLDHVRSRHGSVAAFLEGPAGVGTEDLEHLEAALVA